jgi:hypothetical protein
MIDADQNKDAVHAELEIGTTSRVGNNSTAATAQLSKSAKSP